MAAARKAPLLPWNDIEQRWLDIHVRLCHTTALTLHKYTKQIYVQLPGRRFTEVYHEFKRLEDEEPIGRRWTFKEDVEFLRAWAVYQLDAYLRPIVGGTDPKLPSSLQLAVSYAKDHPKRTVNDVRARLRYLSQIGFIKNWDDAGW